MDITKEEKDIAVLTSQVSNIETNISDIKSDLRFIRNAIMVVSFAAVGAMAVLINQANNSTLEIMSLSSKQDILARDVKNLDSKFDAMNAKLDTLITKDKNLNK